jgi:predicted nucleotide-binding protein (sugar kinase/HSP70/actin superfamily)
MFLGHRCGRGSAVSASHPLAKKRIYIPIMAPGSSEALASCFHWLGIEAEVTPPSDARTRELGTKFVNSDECYPAVVTMGDLLRVVERPGFDPARSAFLMPTATGPCRFGQYAPSLRRILKSLGYGDVTILSPTDQNGYADFGEIATAFLRVAWRSVVGTDMLLKALLRTRPYEVQEGATDRAYNESLQELCKTIENSCSRTDCQLRSLVACLERAASRFQSVPSRFHRSLPLIGVVGEIFCRLNSFSNDDLIRKLERLGAEVWLSDISEWIGYTNENQLQDFRRLGQHVSLGMAGAKLRMMVQHADERALTRPFESGLVGYDEPRIPEVLRLARPYLPAQGVLGEMVLSVGKAAYLAMHGADGVIDISPFTCMNGIVSESIYPKLSRDLGGIPIRNFYFDGTQSDLERDLGIYLEMARSYQEIKEFRRVYPPHFGAPQKAAGKGVPAFNEV